MAPEDPRPKSQYSVDEMVDRIKEARSQQRGRSRRRRTHQPKKAKERRLLIAVVAVGLLLLLVVAGVFVLGFVTKVRYEGEQFRRDVSERLALLTGGEVEIGQLVVRRKALQTRHFQFAEAGEDAFLSSVEARGLVGEVNFAAFLGGDWRLDPLQVADAEVWLRIPSPGAGVGVGGDVLVPRVAGFGLSSRPGAVVLGLVRAQSVDVLWGGGGDAAVADGVRGSDWSAEMLGNSLGFYASGGTFRSGGLPEWSLESAHGKVDRASLALDRVILSGGGRGKVTMKGGARFALDGELRLEGEAERLLLGELMPDYWRERLGGEYGGEFQYVLPFGDPAGVELTGRFEVHNFALRDLPVLDALAIYTAEANFYAVEIGTLEGDFVSRDGRLVLSGFSASRWGSVRLGGEIVVGRDGTLGGVLEIGVAAATFDRLRAGRPAFFQPSGGGLVTAEIQLGGTVEAPEEDLTAKIRALVDRRASRTGADALLPLPGEGAGVLPEGLSPPEEEVGPPNLDPEGGASLRVPSLVPGAEGAADPPGDTRDEQLEKAFEELIR